MSKSLASMHKRPAGVIPQPASKAPRLPGPPLAASPAKRTSDPARPTTAGKSLQLTPSASAGQTRMGSGSDAAGGDGTPQPVQGKTSAFDPPWPLGHMRVKTQASQSGGSSGSRMNIGGAYAQYLTDNPSFADDSTSRPDYNQYAKRMVKTLTRSEKEAVPAVHQVNLDRINSLLAEVNNPNALCLSQALLLPDE